MLRKALAIAGMVVAMVTGSAEQAAARSTGEHHRLCRSEDLLGCGHR